MFANGQNLEMILGSRATVLPLIFVIYVSQRTLFCGCTCYKPNLLLNIWFCTYLVDRWNLQIIFRLIRVIHESQLSLSDIRSKSVLKKGVDVFINRLPASCKKL